MNGRIWPSQEAQDFPDLRHCQDIQSYEHPACHEPVFFLSSLWNLCPSSEKSSAISSCPLLPPGLAGFMPAHFSQYGPLLAGPLLPVWPPAPCYTDDCCLFQSPLSTGLQEGRRPQAPQAECSPPPPLLQCHRGSELGFQGLLATILSST